MKSRQQLKDIFVTGAIPTQQDYAEVFDSYRHITDSIPQSAVAGLAEALANVQGGSASHSHAIADTTGLQSALDSKAAASHTHEIDDIDSLATTLQSLQNAVATPASHSHAIADTTGLQSALNSKAAANHTHSDLETAISGKAAASHSHAIADTTGLQSALDSKADSDHSHSGYAAASHTHAISNITNLQSTLNGKAAANHTHSISDITGYTAGVHVDHHIYVYEGSGSFNFLPESVGVPFEANTLYFLDLYGSNMPDSGGAITLDSEPVYIRQYISDSQELDVPLSPSHITNHYDPTSFTFRVVIFYSGNNKLYFVSGSTFNHDVVYAAADQGVLTELNINGTTYTIPSAPDPVSVTPVVTSGTKIATIDGTDIFAPEAQQSGGSSDNAADLLEALVWAQFGKDTNATGNCSIPVLLQGGDAPCDLYYYPPSGESETIGYGLQDHCRFFYNGKFFSNFTPSDLQYDGYYTILDTAGYSGSNCVYWKFLPNIVNSHISSGSIYRCLPIWADYDSPDTSLVADGVYFRHKRLSDSYGNTSDGDLVMCLVQNGTPYNIDDPNLPYFLGDMRNIWLESYDPSGMGGTCAYQLRGHDLVYFNGKWFSTYGGSFEYDDNAGDFRDPTIRTTTVDGNGDEIPLYPFYYFGSSDTVDDYASLVSSYGLEDLGSATVHLCQVFALPAFEPAQASDSHVPLWWDNPETGIFERILAPASLFPDNGPMIIF